MTFDPELLTGLGAAMAVFLSATGAAIASAHSGIFAVRSHTFKNFVPIVQAGVLAIYGLIIGVLLCGKFQNNDDDAAQPPMTAVDGYRNLSAGLAVGLACWASGYGMASFIRQCNEGKHNLMVATNNKPAVTGGATADREPLLNDNNNNNEDTVTEPDFVKLVFVMIFLESIGLYGLIVSLFLMG